MYTYKRCLHDADCGKLWQRHNLGKTRLTPLTKPALHNGQSIVDGIRIMWSLWQRWKKRQTLQTRLCYFSHLVLIFRPAARKTMREECFTHFIINTRAISTSAISINNAFSCYLQIFHCFIGHLRCFVANFLVLIFFGPFLYLCYFNRFFHLWQARPEADQKHYHLALRLGSRAKYCLR